ncbi:MAG: diaminopimelate epimerase [Bacteroidetes bacterium]|nr:diaminopimelate epimerase [Bacteroidota bacterium]MBI3481477.1 diaminopimelate epimerase [Bacteroidota bacterium]
MKFSFQKYQATGNDFVIVDNRDAKYSFSVDQIKKICDRKFGVGADGIMLIEKHPSLDFNLVYYNADGSASLCGNGSRAAVRVASSLGLVNGKAKFNAYDGLHEADLLQNGNVRLKMNDVKEVKKLDKNFFINTGSPHFVQFVNEVKIFPVFEEGKKIRHSENFKPKGTNANFIELLGNNSIFVRTYERGVEDETLSCGTGVTAAALASSFHQYSSPVTVKTLGGELSVEFNLRHDGSFTDIFLIGPAKMVFEGVLEL